MNNKSMNKTVNPNDLNDRLEKLNLRLENTKSNRIYSKFAISIGALGSILAYVLNQPLALNITVCIGGFGLALEAVIENTINSLNRRINSINWAIGESTTNSNCIPANNLGIEPALGKGKASNTNTYTYNGGQPGKCNGHAHVSRKKQR